MDDIPFAGAVEKIKEPKRQVVKRGKFKCKCGAIDQYNTEWLPYHDEDCISRKGKKGKKK